METSRIRSSLAPRVLSRQLGIHQPKPLDPTLETLSDVDLAVRGSGDGDRVIELAWSPSEMARLAQKRVILGVDEDAVAHPVEYEDLSIAEHCDTDREGEFAHLGSRNAELLEKLPITRERGDLPSTCEGNINRSVRGFRRPTDLVCTLEVVVIKRKRPEESAALRVVLGHHTATVRRDVVAIGGDEQVNRPPSLVDLLCLIRVRLAEEREPMNRAVGESAHLDEDETAFAIDGAVTWPADAGALVRTELVKAVHVEQVDRLRCLVRDAERLRVGAEANGVGPDEGRAVGEAGFKLEDGAGGGDRGSNQEAKDWNDVFPGPASLRMSVTAMAHSWPSHRRQPAERVSIMERYGSGAGR